MKNFVITFFVVSMMLSSSLEAEISINRYKKVIKESGEEGAFKTIGDYIAGVGIGYSWANTYSENIKQNPLYCQNSKLALNNRNYFDIMHQECMRGTYNDDTPIELILLFGLQKTFPCN